ncbi:hypothetical protein [Dactylosporangium sp. CA-092794]|uniref:hypothetical protein n=1 Tax=Dactylosporangium sp. CA-092794 TaxID=3239929 RepID=UPI003D8DCB43
MMPELTGRRRIPWTALPPGIRSAVERRLGTRVTAAADRPGGFSPGVAATLHLATGRAVFVKVTRSDPEAGFHRREIAINRRLPPAAPVPRLLDAYDDGTWVALVFEHVDGALPAQPWHPADLTRALTAATAAAEALTPSPIPAAEASRPRLTGGPFTGDTLLHGDLYPFNILLTPDEVRLVDWPHAWVGPPYGDVLTLLSTAPLSGLNPEPLLAANPLTRGVAAEEIDAYLAAQAGYLLRLAATAAPSTDPALRTMAATLGRSALRWLRVRSGGQQPFVRSGGQRP